MRTKEEIKTDFENHSKLLGTIHYNIKVLNHQADTVVNKMSTINQEGADAEKSEQGASNVSAIN